jgi:integrase
MQTHLTDLVVQRVQKPGMYFDKTTPGFGVRVGKNRKTWVIMRGQIRQRVRIGYYPAMSLADARKEAKKLLTEAPTRNPAITFATAYEDYKQSLATRRPKSQSEYKRLMSKYFVPRIGRRRLAELQYEDVIACVEKAAPSEASHALAVCRAFLRWCVRPPRRYLTHSPLESVQLKPSRKRKRILTTEELLMVWEAAEEQGYPHGTIVQLLIAMGQRRGETANLRWPWINESTERLVTALNTPRWMLIAARKFPTMTL